MVDHSATEAIKSQITVSRQAVVQACQQLKPMDFDSVKSMADGYFWEAPAPGTATAEELEAWRTEMQGYKNKAEMLKLDAEARRKMTEALLEFIPAVFEQETVLTPRIIAEQVRLVGVALQDEAGAAAMLGMTETTAELAAAIEEIPEKARASFEQYIDQGGDPAAFGAAAQSLGLSAHQFGAAMGDPSLARHALPQGAAQRVEIRQEETGGMLLPASRKQQDCP